ncbi:uncharacterized protein EV422DRAFT_71133 [Fimicolochytrium jonesii]|uniref:uncharacterized protein n=1 Tax=Fimicolochytrium jonesii TaxID=1396493 RepID=UPI0022FDF068|nr:uncharacterized protein EV422DRAFT_71133 [Fimicolochytrium jonesii]KAI8820464.1 hypothetical protein EV422DRAFT_71133 [Fimicolochytrium jonesii]
MASRHKKPFSQKAKKVQLQQKRLRKKDDDWGWDDAGNARAASPTQRSRDSADRPLSDSDASHHEEATLVQPRNVVDAAYGHGALESVFAKLPPDVVERRKKESMQPLEHLPDTSLEVSFEELYSADAVIDIPKRPIWSYKDSRYQLEVREEAYFKQWMEGVYSKHRSDELSYFEHNLDVWRQLWRVCEMSDILLFIVDVRHPVLHFPPSLYDYVVKDLKRKLVLVFNKIDLVTSETLEAWTIYFRATFPELIIASFSCYSKNDFVKSDAPDVVRPASKRRAKPAVRGVGVPEVLRACRDVHLIKNQAVVNWDALVERAEVEQRQKDEEDRIREQDKGEKRRRQRIGDDVPPDDESVDSESEEVDEHDRSSEAATSDVTHEGFEPHKDWVTIGFVGHPNVGKSSLINSLMGKKVVSTSRTPGHTKHFQTIHLTANVRFCDCPGLVFPGIIPKPLQILSGMYRISQVQEPYTAIAYLAARMPLEKILALQHPDAEKDDEDHGQRPAATWSAWQICEAFAYQRGFLTARTSRPDVYRAANLILRMCVDGKIRLVFKPKGFKEGLWNSSKPSDSDSYVVQDGEDASSEEESDGSESDGIQGGGAFDLLADLEI